MGVGVRGQRAKGKGMVSVQVNARPERSHQNALISAGRACFGWMSGVPDRHTTPRRGQIYSEEHFFDGRNVKKVCGL